MSQEDLNELARSKLLKILGAEQGERVFVVTLRELGFDRLTSADALHQFSQRLVRHGGIVGAAGAMLGLMAVMRGAQGSVEEPHS